jgi:hypothetical protein
MRTGSRWIVGLVTFVALPLAGCIEETPSLYPLFETSERLPGIEGDWVEEDGNDRLKIIAAEDGYDLPLVDFELKVDGKPEPFDLRGRVRFGRLSDRWFADFTAADKTGDLDGTNTLALWPVHVFARVNYTRGRLELARLKEAWLHDAVSSGRIYLEHKKVGEDMVLTASTEDLQRVLSDWAFLDEAFDTPDVFVRADR